ncbi:MAG: response regulator transcription factor [Candidimonas sp.]|nr:MAG: response regulator transcription factor [Candidimonas sp.]TAM22740.1 MAG: response regulator transcription factor [Candidimonas sp.]TAM74526.1 MAG: response regulator transcription factor [Candidimonas sp.]
MIKIIVIESQHLLRLGIMQVLSVIEPDAQIEGVGYDFIAQETHADGDVDLAVISVLSAQDMTKLIQAAKRVYSPKWILLLSDTATAPDCLLDFPSAIAGCINKHSSPEVLMASIKLILLGGSCFPAPAASGIFTPKSDIPMAPLPVTSHTGCDSVFAFPPSDSACKPVKMPAQIRPENKSPAMASTEAKLLNITQRQYEVLVLLAQGYPIKTVSRHLNISVATAKAHTETLYQRLDVHNRNEAVYAAISRGASLGWTRTNANSHAEAA